MSFEARVKSSKDDRDTAFVAMLRRVGTDEFNRTRLYLSIASLRHIPRELFSRPHETWCALKSPNISDRDVRDSRKVKSKFLEEGDMYTLQSISPLTVMHKVSNSDGLVRSYSFEFKESRTKKATPPEYKVLSFRNNWYPGNFGVYFWIRCVSCKTKISGRDCIA